MTAFLLDTHIWIAFANGDPTLSKSIRNTINSAAQQGDLYIAAISLWEIAMLVNRKRIILEMPCLEWINRSIDLIKINISPLTPSVAVESCQLPNGFHQDPADRLIVATARTENMTIITRDRQILKYSQRKYVSCLKA